MQKQHPFYRKERPTRTYVYWFIGLALLVPLLSYAGLAKAVGPLFNLPTKENFVPTQTIFYDRTGVKLYETEGAHQPIPVKLDQVPRTLVLATLAAEDADFYRHRGVDPTSLTRATYKTLFSDKPQGGSTITQQLIKTTYLSSERTTSRKLHEMTYALLLESRFSKDQILERYMNEIYYGQQSYGVADAAKTYFGKDLAALDLAESTMLAGLTSSPTQYSPLGANPQLAKQRQKYVLDRMVSLYPDIVTRAQADAALNQPLAYAQREQVFHAPHFVFYVKQELARYYGDKAVDQGGLKVYTTLDLAKQQTLEEEVKKGVAAVRSGGATNGSAVALDPKNGEVLAMVGSADFNNDAIDGKVNIATSDRQPGSSFKPFVYLEALKQGKTAATVLHDRSTTFGGDYTPRNYDGTFRGNVTMRYALANSLNIPSVELLEQVGVQPALDMAKQLGISTLGDPARYGLSLVLGGGEVKLLDMTSAYGVIANKGVNPGRATVTKVVGPHEQTLYQRTPQPKPVVTEGQAYILTDILDDDRARKLAFGPNNPLNFPRPAAVKTGTTNDFKDNWTVGYTPNLVVGVWVGNNDGTPMRGLSGVEGAAPIWNSAMQQLLKGVPSESFTVPGDLVRSCACVSAIGGSQFEFFLKGTVTVRDVPGADLPSTGDTAATPPPRRSTRVPTRNRQQQTAPNDTSASPPAPDGSGSGGVVPGGVP